MKLLKILFFFLLILSFSYAFALLAPSNIVLDKAYEDRLEISWAPSVWAEIYAVSYGKTSAEGWTYENELEIVVNEDAKAVIENLEVWTEYFIAVKSYDSLGNESEYSKEVSFSTLWQLQDLKIDSAEMISANLLKLSFNLNLKKDVTWVSVNVVSLEDSLEDIEVNKYETNSNNLELTLNGDLKKKSKYSATVVTLEWENWEKIKAWVDGVIEFEVPEVFKEIENEDLQAAWISDENNELEDLENEVSPKEEIEVSNNDMNEQILNSGDEIKEDKVIVETVAKKKESLPNTWPTETFLFFVLAFIVWSLLFVFKRERNS